MASLTVCLWILQHVQPCVTCDFHIPRLFNPSICFILELPHFSLALHTSFIEVNTFHLAFILLELSMSISRRRFTVYFEQTYSFTTPSSSFPTPIWPCTTFSLNIKLYWFVFVFFFQGDSGGPLYCPSSNGQMVLAGVTSFGLNCETEISAFSDLGYFRDWIENNV